MSISYTWVQWNRHKKIYDMVLAASVVVYLVLFILISSMVWTGEHAISPMTLLIRATGTCALVMLHIILVIGPLHRLDARFAPLLYNRRHMGVTMFHVALIHGVLVMIWYGAFGVVNPLKAMLAMNLRYDSLTGFPFEALGILALVILFYMAATSHDFWLKFLSPRWWKAMHMLVYLAYALLVMHVALGAIQGERSAAYPILLGLGLLSIVGLHLTAGLRECQTDSRALSADAAWIDVADVDKIPEDRAKVVTLAGRGKVAVFRYQGKVSAVANVCAHQGGPLGEGKILDGCITCPWHGYQYRPEDGQSPPPFTEKIATYKVRIKGNRVLIAPKALEPGTPVKPAAIGDDDDV